MVLRFEHFGMSIRKTLEVLKCGAEEGWGR
jgi:hypothetical protein